MLKRAHIHDNSGGRRGGRGLVSSSSSGGGGEISVQVSCFFLLLLLNSDTSKKRSDYKQPNTAKEESKQIKIINDPPWKEPRRRRSARLDERPPLGEDTPPMTGAEAGMETERSAEEAASSGKLSPRWSSQRFLCISNRLAAGDIFCPLEAGTAASAVAKFHFSFCRCRLQEGGEEEENEEEAACFRRVKPSGINHWSPWTANQCGLSSSARG